MRSPSILHVAQPLREGVPAVVARLTEDQLSRGWSVAVATPSDSVLREWATERGVRWLDWPATRALGPSLPAEIRRFAAIVDQTQPELVHLHSAKAGLVGRLVLRGRRPTAYQPHAWSFEPVRGPVRAVTIASERWLARWSDVIVCVSEDERRRAEAVGLRARWAVVPNGVDLSQYAASSPSERAHAREKLGLSSGPVAVAVGRFCEQKGQDVLLRAWPEVRQEVPEAELVLVGDGPTRSELLPLVSPGVRLAGRTDEIRPWLAAADVTVMPSRWEAGLSLVTMEAMARARSVVATDTAGVREAIGDECGAVVPIDAPAPLARALSERLRDRGRADREGAAGRALVERRHHLPETTARMAEVYLEVLARRGAGR